MIPQAFEWKKVKKCIFGCYCGLLYNNASSFKPYGTRDQGHLVTLAEGLLSVYWQHFHRASSLETTWPITSIFHMQPSTKRGKENLNYDPGHITKMAAMPIYHTNIEQSSSPEPL